MVSAQQGDDTSTGIDASQFSNLMRDGEIGSIDLVQLSEDALLDEGLDYISNLASETVSVSCATPFSVVDVPARGRQRTMKSKKIESLLGNLPSRETSQTGGRQEPRFQPYRSIRSRWLVLGRAPLDTVR